MIDDFNIQFSTQKLLEDIEETSVSSGVGAYQARSGMGKDSYKKHPGDRTTGGMIYRDLWEAEEGERVKITGHVQHSGETGTVDSVHGGFVVVRMDSDGKKYSFHSSNVSPDEEEDLEEVFSSQEKDKVYNLLDKLKQIDYDAYKKLLMAIIDPKPYKYADAESELAGNLGLSEEMESELSEGYIPDNIKKFAKTKGATSTVNQIARWAEKAGKRITGGTAIGKHYSTLILDLTYQGGEVSIDTDNNTIKVNGHPIADYSGFEKALGSKKIYENYSRFKNETKTRPKADQFHQAIREVKKRVHEIHKVLEYVNRLKEELSEGDSDLKYKKHTEDAMMKLKEMVSELNHKIEKFK